MKECVPSLKQSLELDLSTAEITEALARAPIYVKKGLVRLRPTVAGERIVTRLADGTEETVNVAGENQFVVTNPSGEAYIIGAEKMAKGYEATAEPGVFRARGMVRAIPNPTHQDIRIMAPWGEEQFGTSDAMIASPYEPDQPDIVCDDRYIIGGAEFQETYDPTVNREG